METKILENWKVIEEIENQRIVQTTHSPTTRTHSTKNK